MILDKCSCAGVLRCSGDLHMIVLVHRELRLDLLGGFDGDGDNDEKARAANDQRLRAGHA